MTDKQWNSDKMWKNILIWSCIVVFGGTAAILFLLTDVSSDGTITMTSRPLWAWILGGLIGIGAFMISLFEVRRRNEGKMNANVILQTIVYVGFFIGVLILFRYFRGG